MEEGAKKAAAAAPPSPPPPDYAKGLSNLNGPKPDENTNAAPSSSPPEPATPAPPAAPPAATPATPDTPPPLASPLLVHGSNAKPIVIGQQPKLLIAGPAGGKPLLLSTQNLLNTSTVILQPGGKAVLLQNIKPMTQTVVQQAARSVVPAVHTQPPLQHQIAQPAPAPVQPAAVVPAAPAAAPLAATQSQPLLPRRGLSLTREQMLEAQDMFRNANRVTRPEKALILGFMAGSRDNPCPNLGNIVTIKLSENIENVLQSDDTYLTMLSEMHFQMNYNNGQWTRLKKYRHIDGMVPQKIPPGSTVISSNNQQPIVSIANQSVS